MTGFREIENVLKRLLDIYCELKDGDPNVQLAYSFGRRFVLFHDGDPIEFNNLEELVAYLKELCTKTDEDDCNKIEEVVITFTAEELEAFEDYLFEILETYYEVTQEDNIHLYLIYRGWGLENNGEFDYEDLSRLEDLPRYIEEKCLEEKEDYEE